MLLAKTPKISMDDMDTPRVTLIIGSFILSIILTLFFWGTRKLYLLFLSALERYHMQLFNFSETPRSKVAKKYLPPMEPLQEQESLEYSTKYFESKSNYTPKISFHDPALFAPIIEEDLYTMNKTEDESTSLRTCPV